jgi:two-component system LytT family response regulator
MIRVLIVDDEPLAREGVRLRLEKEQDIVIEAECSNGTEAIRLIKSCKPDLVFLDIQMPGMSGFEMLQHLKCTEYPLIIFITAYDAYAMEAFRAHALDYLLKPIDDDHFRYAVEHARIMIKQSYFSRFASQVQEMLSHFSTSDSLQSVSRIAVKEKGKVIFIETGEIDWIEAAGDYVYLHVKNKKHLIRTTVSDFSNKLNPREFQRIHRSVIINLNRISEMQGSDHGEFRVILKDGRQLKMSRTYRESLEKALGTAL